MSATNRGLERSKDDFYRTPAWCVHRLLEWFHELGFSFTGEWLEPCVGGGAIVNAVNEWGATEYIKPSYWAVNDINPIYDELAMVYEHTQLDYLGADWKAFRQNEEKFSLLVTNPPYTLAQEFIERGLKDAHVGAYLLRLNFLGSQKRATWLDSLGPTILVLPNRPAFSLDKHGKPGTDATEYAWFVFGVPSTHEAYRKWYILNTTSSEEIKKANKELLDSKP